MPGEPIDDSSNDPLRDVDLAEWWDDSEYALNHYVGEPPDNDLVASIEAELGVRLPRSYVETMRRHNGGLPNLTCFPTFTRTTWAEDHIEINGIFGLDRGRDYSLCGTAGSQFWIREWGYPDLGVYFADCPSAGHDMVAMDYRNCGPSGEPRIVHVDQEWEYSITVLASSFTEFVTGLRPADHFDTD